MSFQSLKMVLYRKHFNEMATTYQYPYLKDESVRIDKNKPWLLIQILGHKFEGLIVTSWKYEINLHQLQFHYYRINFN